MKLKGMLFEAQGRDNKEQMELFLELLGLKEFPHSESKDYLKYVDRFMKFAKFFREIEEKQGAIPDISKFNKHKDEIVSA